MRDWTERLLATLLCVAIAVFTFYAVTCPQEPVNAQSPTPAPFIEWQVATEYTSPATGQLTTGRLTLLTNRATGDCWIVYPQHGIAPAPRAVCSGR